MKFKGVLLLILVVTISGCNNANHQESHDAKSSLACSDECKTKNSSGELSCTLTTPELQERKRTVLKSLKEQVIEKKELKTGYAFKFSGTDEMVDELTEFIKTERACCNFFTFNLSVSGDKTEAWLELTGPEGAKDFIESELGL